jgi:hypothetical protein
VVEPGDRLRAEGELVQGPENSLWLDLTQVHTLVATPLSARLAYRLVGVDVSSVPSTGNTDSSLMPNWVGVVGRWLDDAITVEEQWSVHWPPREPLPPSLTRPAPSGGWNVEDQSNEVQGLDELRASGAIVEDGWLRHKSGAVLLRVAAADVAAVDAVLAPQLPRRLCVVRSRYSTADLREVRAMFDAHHRKWGFSTWGCGALDAQCQPYAHVTLTRVSADLARWADTLPDGLLRLHPRMTPA